MTTIEEFAALVEKSQRERIVREWPATAAVGGWGRAEIHTGPKYSRVDFDKSGKYMVVNATGEIYGIKAYGVIHRGHYYGTLDTIDQWDWSGYRAVRKQPVRA